MRSAISFVVIAILSLASGCEHVTEGVESECATCGVELQVHLNNNFENDRVRVEIDDRLVFDDRITTNYRVSLAEVIELRRPAGEHRFEVEVNGSYRKAATFELDRPLYIHVRFYREPIPAVGIQKGLVIEVTDRQPVYY